MLDQGNNKEKIRKKEREKGKRMNEILILKMRFFFDTVAKKIKFYN